MAYEVCPECGAKKHQVMACASCGFKRTVSFAALSRKPVRNNLNKPEIDSREYGNNAAAEPPSAQGNNPVQQQRAAPVIAYVENPSQSRAERQIEKLMITNPQLTREQAIAQLAHNRAARSSHSTMKAFKRTFSTKSDSTSRM